MKPHNILITGSGGQGVVSSGDLLAKIFFHFGFTPNATQSHGFSQRGGYVLYFLRIGDSLLSPLIEEESCDDYILLNPNDELRYGRYLNPSTRIFSAELLASDEAKKIHFKSMILIGMLLKNLTLNLSDKPISFPFKEVEPILKAHLKKRLDENVAALELGYRG